MGGDIGAIELTLIHDGDMGGTGVKVLYHIISGDMAIEGYVW